MDIHIARWEELPDFSLYMDQVVGIVEKSLSFLKTNEEDKIITSTMINNYVKAKLVKAPVKKRYDREHLAYFTVICLLKRVYSLDEISKLLKLAQAHRNLSSSYDLFCDYLEALLRHEDKPLDFTDHELAELFKMVMKSVVYAFTVSKDITSLPTLSESAKMAEEAQEEAEKQKKEAEKKLKKEKKKNA